MKGFLLLLVAHAITISSFAQPSDAALLAKMDQGHMPGASLVVIKEGKWMYNRNLGQANIDKNIRTDSNTIFMMASVSKTMTVTAIMQLWERGLIDLDVDINSYLSFPVRTPSFPNDAITARMLLTHASAIRDDWSTLATLYVPGDSPVSLDSFLRNYLVPGGIFYNTSNFYTYQPGTDLNYSNVASTLAAYLVESITGDAFSHYCDTAIFKKLCMNSSSFLLAGIQDQSRIARPYSYDVGTYYDEGLYGYPDYPDGQLRSTIIDMARFMTMYMQRGEYAGNRILQSNSIDTIFSQQTSLKWSQGLMFYASIAGNGDTLWGHNGGDAGVNTSMMFNLKKQIGAIALTNGGGTSISSADGLVAMLYSYGVTGTPGANSDFPACTFPVSVSSTSYQKNDLAVYPNPSNGVLNVTTPVDGKLLVYDMQGRILYQSDVRKGTHTMNLDSVTPGMCMVKVMDMQGAVAGISRFKLMR